MRHTGLAIVPPPSSVTIYRDLRRNSVQRRAHLQGILAGRVPQVSDDLWEALVSMHQRVRRHAVIARHMAMQDIRALHRCR